MPDQDLTQWIGRAERTSDEVTATPYAALAATLDRTATRPAVGTPLPAPWHWLYFLPLARQSDIGPDGHARRGGFLPPVSLPRRMWAGSEMTFGEPLRIGDAIARVSTVEGVHEKAGRSGPLVFVKVRHEIYANASASPSITEFHDIVYREARKPSDPVVAPVLAPGAAAFSRDWVPDDVLLFRYSALTFNGHRIHYDRRYVTEVEGYPGLIVHGPLIATLLLDLLRDQQPDRRVVRFAFRAVRPLFDLHPFKVCGTPDADGRTFKLWAQDHEGWIAMDAEAEIV